MILKKWKSLCNKAREKDYECLQLGGLAKIGGVRDTIKECNKFIYIQCIPETKPFSMLLNVVCN